MTPQTLLIGACLFVAVIASVALIRAAEWSRAHWLLLVLLAASLVVLALVLWHRRMMAYHRAQWATGEGWDRLPSFARQDLWACPYCRALVGGLDHAEAHMDPAESACAAYQQHLEEQEDAGRRAPDVDVMSTPGRGWPAVLDPQKEAIEDA